MVFLVDTSIHAGQLARLACLWEASARKVGNVHPERDFDDLHYADFVHSAEAIAPVLARASQQSVGQTILAAIEATRRVTATNTNLGIVLLLAPLAAVPETQPLAEGLELILNGLSVADSRDVFAAIRLAQPGGLGRASAEDVHAEPTLPLRAIMALAAGRDLIARQYANGFQEVLGEGVPCLRRWLAEGRGREQAIILTHLAFLARHPDSLIARKHGPVLAEEVSRRASALLALKEDEQERGRAIGELDAWLRGRRLNPGTSADLVTACLFVALREGMLTGE